MSSSTTDNNNSGVAGRTNYSEWGKKTNELVSQLESDEKLEEEQAKEALGLQDGKYARSDAEAMESTKSTEVAKKKKILDAYQKRESGIVQVLSNLTLNNSNDEKEVTRYITRNDLEAGKRVLTVSDTTGPGHVILTQDLTNLESEVPMNTTLSPKSFPQDAENSIVEEKEEEQKMRKIQGLIKVQLANLHDMTVTLRCKVITGLLEISHCSNLTVKLEKDSTIVTVQADLCQGLNLEFHDAPSGKSKGLPTASTTIFWGGDKDDRIFHAGVSKLKVQLYRDGFVDLETMTDYKENGAASAGNATPEEVQFATSVLNGEMVTEKVLRNGMPITDREMKEVERKKEEIRKAVDQKLGGIKIIDKDGNEVAPKKDLGVVTTVDDDTIEVNGDIESIIKDCESQKAKGNEAFVAGEYAQALLLYTLALDKADELPDVADNNDKKESLFPRHVVYSNRSACFLKLGHHEKALADGIEAEKLDPTYVKGTFRKGLALHAMQRYKEAAVTLAAALKLEPKNKQIKQALQMADVRLQQEMRKRMAQ